MNRILYINGLKTSADEAENQRAWFREWAGAPVSLCFNPTLLWTTGLIECFFQKWFGRVWATPQVKVLTRMIREMFLLMGPEDKVYLIGHSQGCLQAINAALRLPEMYRRRVVLILFACPAAREPDGLAVEYWRNTGDPVLGALYTVRRYEGGRCFWRHGDGHGLVEYYLEKITEFDKHTESEFWRMKGVKE